MPKKTGSAGIPQKTAALLAQGLAHRIASGTYGEGDLLPSCRRLARELDIDKDTVSKAYGLLERSGIVKMLPGRGFLVLRTAPGNGARAGVEQNLDSAIWYARAMGMDEEQLWRTVAGAISRYYGLAQVQVAYVALDRAGAEHFARQIEAQVGLGIHAVTCPELAADPVHFAACFDILATSFNTLAAVQEIVGAYGGHVVGLHTLPVSDDVLPIAAARKGSKVAVICDQKPNTDPLINLVKSYNPDVECLPCLATDTPCLSRRVAEADLIVDTFTSHPLVLDQSPAAPLVTMSFRIEEQSVEFLRAKVWDILIRRHMPEPNQPTEQKGRMS
jgi:DNA-binding transcriptional regulator YhcF (GntR family)